MRRPEYRIAILMICALTVTSGATNQTGSLNGEQQDTGPAGFSRSAWILQHSREVPFSSGVLPVTDPLPLPAQFAPSVDSVAESLATNPLRINHDLLASDTLAQPGTQAEPYVHANPFTPSNLVAGWQENRFRNGGARALNYAASFDGGQTWTEGILPKLTTVDGGRWQKASDPWVAFGPNDRAYFASLLFNETTPESAIGVSLSTDGGRNWGPPVEVFRSISDFNDKESLTVDTSPSSPFFGYIYVTWDINVSAMQRLVVSRSTDGGSTFSSPVIIRDGPENIGVIPRVGPDGTLYLVWTGNKGSGTALFFSKSMDGGLSWSKKRKLAKLRLADLASLRTGNILASFAVDPGRGDLYVAWQDRRWTGTGQATLISSRDGGDNWSSPARVSDGPDDAAAFTISVATNGSGQTAVSYYSLQNDPARSFLVDEYVCVSGDGGNRFEPSVRVTPASFDIRFAAQAGNGFFLGDYAGLTGTREGFQMVWVGTTTRSEIASRLQPDVFTSSITGP